MRDLPASMKKKINDYNRKVAEAQKLRKSIERDAAKLRR